MLSQLDKEILLNEDFQQLVKVRRRVSWSFLMFLLGLYSAFGFLSIYSPAVLARPVFAGGIVPFGVLMGYAILASAFIITLIYVWISNNYFVPLEKKVIEAIKAGART